MNIYQKPSKIVISIVIVGLLIFRPLPSAAKSLSFEFINIFKIADFKTKESSIAVATSSVQPAEVGEEDQERQDRIDRINKYFEQRNMPLAGYGEDFLEVAEKCGMDWRLLPAIGVRESSGGKNQFNNNPFGWGSAKIKFNDFKDAIQNVGEHLCGLRPSTERYYKDKTTYKKLWYYNGTVIASYPSEVIDIMEMF